MNKGIRFIFSSCLEETRHCYFVISRPDPSGEVLVVNISTYRGFKGEETTCIINSGENCFITQTSYVVYSRALTMTLQDIKNNRNPIYDVSDDLLLKIQNGAKQSDFLPAKFYKYFNLF